MAACRPSPVLGARQLHLYTRPILKQCYHLYQGCVGYSPLQHICSWRNQGSYCWFVISHQSSVIREVRVAGDILVKLLREIPCSVVDLTFVWVRFGRLGALTASTDALDGYYHDACQS